MIPSIHVLFIQFKEVYSPGLIEIFENNSTLVFNQITKGLAGTYKCEIETDLRIHISSDRLKIIVEDRPLENNYCKSK